MIQLISVDKPIGAFSILNIQIELAMTYSGCTVNI